MTSIFLCHSSKDKELVRELNKLLRENQVKTWFDEAEIKPGEVLLEKISEGINDVDYLGVILSKNSVDSNWVMKELSMAMNKEIIEKNVKVLPILIEDCEIPIFLQDKKYVDLTKKDCMLKGVRELIGTLKPIKQNKIIKKENDNKKRYTLLDLNKFKELYDYTYNKLDLPKDNAKKVAMMLMPLGEKTINKFKELTNYGYEEMDLTAISAVNFAFDWFKKERELNKK